jgi:hypothetical protein
VLTRDAAWSAPGAEVAGSLEAALALAGDGPVSIVGGGQIYAQALPLATTVEITEIHAALPGDTHFPARPRMARGGPAGNAAARRHAGLCFRHFHAGDIGAASMIAFPPASRCPPLHGAIVALGNFDGFHLGHQAVVGEAVRWARETGARRSSPLLIRIRWNSSRPDRRLSAFPPGPERRVVCRRRGGCDAGAGL